MATREEWDEAVGRIRADPTPFRSPHLHRLYDLAREDGPRALASFRRPLGEARTTDLLYDFLALKLQAILDAESPRAFFLTALRNHAFSWVRRGDAKVVESPPDSSRETAADGSEDERRAFMIDAREALAKLSERDQGIVKAVGSGELREDVARAFGTSRANVDQIVSRTHRRFWGEGS